MTEESNQVETAIPTSFDAANPTPELVEELKRELNEANLKAQEYWDKLLRREAELQNINKQTQKRVQDAHQFAIEGFVKELLVILDTFERALAASHEGNASLESMREGISLTQKQFTDSLARFAVTPVEASVGVPFNPQYHQALTTVETTEVPAQHIMAVVQTGYQLHGRLIRPAGVIVAKEAKE